MNNTTTTTRSIRTGAYVALSNKTIGNAKHFAKVLDRTVLDGETLSTDLGDAGWRLAEFPDTGYRVLVRPTTDRRIGNLLAVNVECHTIDTGVALDEDRDTFAIVTVMGAKRANVLARRDDIAIWG